MSNLGTENEGKENDVEGNGFSSLGRFGIPSLRPLPEDDSSFLSSDLEKNGMESLTGGADGNEGDFFANES